MLKLICWNSWWMAEKNHCAITKRIFAKILNDIRFICLCQFINFKLYKTTYIQICGQAHIFISVCAWRCRGALKTKGKMSITIVQIHLYIFSFISLVFVGLQSAMICYWIQIFVVGMCIVCERFMCVTHTSADSSSSIISYDGCHFASPFLSMLHMLSIS